MTLQDQIINLLQQKDGLTDREITDALFGKSSPQQPINQTCRLLEARGVIQRPVVQGRIRNHLTGFQNTNSIEKKQSEPPKTIGEKTQKILLSETTIIVVVPFLASFLLFSFLQGYFSYFNIPEQFIAMDLAQILSKLISISLPIYVLVILVVFYLRIKSKETITLFDVAYFVFASVYLITFVLKLFSFNNLVINTIFLYLPIGMIITSFFDKQMRKITISKNKPEITKKPEVFSIFSTGLIVVVIISLSFYLLGFSSAQNQERFYVIQSSPERIVLYLTSEKAIVAEFDRTTRHLAGSFKVLTIDENPDLEFRWEHLGPLVSNRVN
jgi:hypothetical protein